MIMHYLNLTLTEPIFVTQLTKGGVTTPSDFQNEPPYDAHLVQIVSLESPLNIGTKISTNMPSVASMTS